MVLTRWETIKEALHRMEMGLNKQYNVTLLVVQWENRGSKIMLVDRPIAGIQKRDSHCPNTENTKGNEGLLRNRMSWS